MNARLYLCYFFFCTCQFYRLGFLIVTVMSCDSNWPGLHSIGVRLGLSSMRYLLTAFASPRSLECFVIAVGSFDLLYGVMYLGWIDRVAAVVFRWGGGLVSCSEDLLDAINTVF